ncbi:NAD(P)-binding domain-containing protein [Ruegeria sp. 6PALISEP08]|uniref:NAD(P)-binding domain-containing protein n=1 Tax=Ruegeria sp. 6PALISEP08 TaxID=1225660 RepID=UPI00067EB139|nr:NAD(P)-binding domain-containing protein [Ruegeria sp. 6PALISEP08]
MRIGIIGTGTIAAAVVEGMAVDGHPITVSRRSDTKSAALARKFSNVTVADNQEVVDASDVVFLGLIAEQAASAIEKLKFRQDQKVVSLMSGPSLSELEDMVAPASAVANMIPFPGIAVGGSPILVLGDTSIVTDLFGARNPVFHLNSAAELSAYLAAQAVLSPTVLMVRGAGDWLGQQVQDAERGEAFLRALVGSSLTSAPDCRHLLQSLDTPGGYNQRLRKHMESQGILEQLNDGLSDL